MNEKNLHTVDWSKLPAPEDDGAARHLLGEKMPHVELSSTDGSMVKLGALNGTTVIFIYPMTGRPDQDLPENWDMIPGARGCTPQACAFRDLADELHQTGINNVFGLSSQTSTYQREAAARLHLPFQLLSDVDGKLRQALGLPFMKVDGKMLLKRLTLIVHDAKIVQVFYPVFPPDQSARQVLNWANEHLKQT